MQKIERNLGSFFVVLAGIVVVLLAGLLLVSSLTDLDIGRPAAVTASSPPTNSDPTGAVLAAQADVECALQLKMSPTLATIVGEGRISYNVVVKNIGNQTCHDVTGTLTYGRDISFISASPEPVNPPNIWRSAQLKPLQEQTAKILVQVAAGEEATLTNKACVVADNVSQICRSVTVKRHVSDNPDEEPVPVPDEFGMWVWESPLDISAAEATSMFTDLKNDGVNAVYVSVDDYLEIALLTGPTKATRTDAYFAALRQVILRANEQGIAVDAVAGAPDWGVPANRWKGYTLIDLVSSYNQEHPEARLRALQYDVEPYLLSGYESNKASVLTQYVAFIDESMTRLQSVDAAFSLAVPHFFDSTQQWTPAIQYKGKTAHAFTHLLDIMGRKADSTIHLMAYRNYFSGSNGVHELSLPELTEAAPTNVRVVIAQEVGDVLPDFVTFYGFTKNEFFNALQIITTAFDPFTSFGGISVNYLVPYLQMP